MQEFAIYEKHSKATRYIIGFIHRGFVYVVNVATIPGEWIRLEQASRGNGQALRLRIRKACKIAMIEQGKACKLCDIATLKNGKYNIGEQFERLIYAIHNMEWHKDFVPFYVAGDMVVNGEQVQIKFERGTFANTKQLERLENERL